MNLSDSPIRIIVEPSDYRLQNLGDMAMLCAATGRLRGLWPTASIRVLTDTPDLLSVHCPGVEPMTSTGRRVWLTGVRGAHPFLHLPNGIRAKAKSLERYLCRNWPQLVESAMRLRRREDRGRDLKEFLESVSRADLLIVTGMGGITDAFPGYAADLLETLRLAARRGTLTAMMGQGIGPLQNPALRALARDVLPRVDFISLRESRAGGPLLESLGVTADRVMTTGDDAVEMAYKSKPARSGGGLGINLRASDYAEVDQDLVAQVRRILQGAAAAHEASMVPVPISKARGESDANTIRSLLEGQRYPSDEKMDFDTPLDLIAQIHRCRVVVTGSYHAGVFALAQGIPAVGLAKSDYYADKFLGLAQQFGEGCEVVQLHEDDWPVRLAASLDRLWESAENFRPRLLAAAERQIRQSHVAYQRVHDLLMSRKRGIHPAIAEVEPDRPRWSRRRPA